MSAEGGPSRCLADIGSHWCEWREHVTGQRITPRLRGSADIPQDPQAAQGGSRNVAGKTLSPEDYEEVPIDTEDFGAVMFRMGDRTRGCFHGQPG